MLAVHDGLLIGGMGPKRWARLGCVLARVAILLNQTLLPALHFASGSLWPSSAAGASQAIHSHHHDTDRSPVSHDSGAYDHQTCHFCRLSSVGLPPPRLLSLGHIPASGRLVWEAREKSRPHDHFHTGHPARGPSSIAADFIKNI